MLEKAAKEGFSAFLNLIFSFWSVGRHRRLKNAGKNKKVKESILQQHLRPSERVNLLKSVEPDNFEAWRKIGMHVTHSIS